MRFLLSLLYELSIAYPAAKQNPLWTFFTYHSIVNTLNLDNCIRGTLYVQIRNLICTVIHREMCIRDRNQTAINLESYLRNMRRISDAMYYSVIKDKDLATDSLDEEMNLLYEANKDNLISIACYTTVSYTHLHDHAGRYLCRNLAGGRADDRSDHRKDGRT